MILSSEIASIVLLSVSVHWLSLALKSPITTSKNGFFFEIKSSVILKLQNNAAKLSWDWQGDLYSATKLQNLLLTIKSNALSNTSDFLKRDVFIVNVNTTTMGDQSVLNIIVRFPNFHHQYWNKDMFLTTRLLPICVHPHQILKEKTYLQRLQWHIERVCATFRLGLVFSSTSSSSVIKRI